MSVGCRQVKLSDSHHEPLDLSTSRGSTDSTMSSDMAQSLPTTLPSPSDTDPDSKPIHAAAAAAAVDQAVPCRRSSRQRRRTAKAAAAGEDGGTSVDDVVVPARRQRTPGGGGGGSRPAYVCQLCDKEFTKHSSLVRHTYQHSGESWNHVITSDSLTRPILTWPDLIEIADPLTCDLAVGDDSFSSAAHFCSYQSKLTEFWNLGPYPKPIVKSFAYTCHAGLGNSTPTTLNLPTLPSTYEDNRTPCVS